MGMPSSTMVSLSCENTARWQSSPSMSGSVVARQCHPASFLSPMSCQMELPDICPTKPGRVSEKCCLALPPSAVNYKVLEEHEQVEGLTDVAGGRGVWAPCACQLNMHACKGTRAAGLQRLK